jgi:hypothetical protein
MTNSEEKLSAQARLIQLELVQTAFQLCCFAFWEAYCWFSTGSVKRSVLRVGRRRTGPKQLKVTV